MEQLLIIEDDIGLNQGLSKALKADDRQIISCHDLKAAREQLLCGSVSLILLDINLPDGSGLELLREVKENMPGVPVILLTANDTDLDIVDGLERGADDYITKPFSLSVLRARVNTQLRKQASNHKNAPIHIDLFHFDFEAMTFYVGDSKVELSKTEQKLLRLPVLFIFCHPAITDSIDGFNAFLCPKLIPQTLDRNRQSIFIHIFSTICPDPVYKVSTGHGSTTIFNKQTQ